MRRKTLYLLVSSVVWTSLASGVTVFSNLDAADNRVGVRKTLGTERVRYSTFWNTEARPEDHLKVALDGVELLDVPAESVDQGHWFEVNFPRKYEPQTVTLSHGLLSYSAQFANGYTIRFDANGGVGLMDPQELVYGESVNLSRCLFSKVGYTFAGWSAAAVEAEVKYCDTECVADVTDALELAPGSLAHLYAQWRPNVCHLRFHGNGGGGYMAGQDLAYDREKNLVTNGFVRAGYVFCGWARTPDTAVSEFGNGVPVVNLATADDAVLDLYAIWSPLKPNAVGTVWTVDATADSRTEVRKAAAAEHISYGTYWNTDAPNGTVLTVFVDGAEIKTTTTGSDDVAGVFDCALPLRYETQTLVHEHGLLRYTARFANGYTVRFDGNGGVGEMENQTFAYGERKNLSVNRFLKVGYTFNGWTAVPDDSALKYMNGEVAEDVTDALEMEPGSLVTLYAHWRSNSYTVLFDPNGGVGFPSSQSMRYDTDAALNTNGFTKANCIFAGWSEDPQALIPTYGNGVPVRNLTADDNRQVVLYAVWSRLRPDPVETAWTEACDADNRDGVRKARPRERISYGADWNTDATEGTRLDVTRDGEIIKSTATGLDDVAGVFEYELPQRYGVQNLKHEHGLLVYSARFANGHVVRFDSNGGDGRMEIQEFAYGERKNVAANQFTKSGYTFSGWATAPGVAEVKIHNAECVEDITDTLGLEPGSMVTLYAQWRPNDYSVRFHANGGVGFADDQFMRYDVPATLNTNAFSRVNCIFAGWSEDPDALLPQYANGSSVGNLSSADEGVVNLYAVWSRLRPDPVDTAWAGETVADNRLGVRKAMEVEQISYGTGWNTDAPSGSILTVDRDGEILKTAITGEGVFACELPLRYGVQTMTHAYGLLEYTARFANGYTVRFEPNGGVGAMGVQEFAYGERKNILPNQFVRTGYTFAGWAASESGMIKFYDAECVVDITDALEKEPGAMVVLHAQWRPNIYTILFGANGGTGWMDSILAAFDRVVELVANSFANAGQIFAGWATDSNAVVSEFSDEDHVLNLTDQDGGVVELHAVWSQAKPNDVQTVWSVPATADNRDVVRKASTVEHISYGTYWNTDASMGTVLSVDVDGIGVKSTETGSADTAGTFELELPLRYETQTLIPRHGLLLYTSRFANGYTVRFDGNGGRGLMEPQGFAYGERGNLSACRFARNGYSFAGWSAISGAGRILFGDAECVEDVTDAVGLEPGSMVMLYAQWRPNACSFEFNGNGGSGYMESQTVHYDRETALNGNSFTREGYVFCGWATHADADVSDYWDGEIVLNVTNENNSVVKLYALWSPEKPGMVSTAWAESRTADNRTGVRKTSRSELVSYGTYWNTDALGGTALQVARDGTVVKTTSSGSRDVAGEFARCRWSTVFKI